MNKLTEEEFFTQLEGKGYSRSHMNNPFINQMRTDRTWIVDRKTKQTIGHFRNSEYCGKGDFTIYETPLEPQERIPAKPVNREEGFFGVSYTPDSLSIDKIESYIQDIFGKK